MVAPAVVGLLPARFPARERGVESGADPHPGVCPVHHRGDRRRWGRQSPVGRPRGRGHRRRCGVAGGPCSASSEVGCTTSSPITSCTSGPADPAGPVRSRSGRAAWESGGGARWRPSEHGSAVGAAASCCLRSATPSPGELSGPGHRTTRQLVQPGAVRQPHRPAVGLQIDPPTARWDTRRSAHSIRPSCTRRCGASGSSRFSSGPTGVSGWGTDGLRAVRRALYRLGRVWIEMLRIDTANTVAGLRLNVRDCGHRGTGRSHLPGRQRPPQTRPRGAGELDPAAATNRTRRYRRGDEQPDRLRIPWSPAKRRPAALGGPPSRGSPGRWWSRPGAGTPPYTHLRPSARVGRPLPGPTQETPPSSASRRATGIRPAGVPSRTTSSAPTGVTTTAAASHSTVDANSDLPVTKITIEYSLDPNFESGIPQRSR